MPMFSVAPRQASPEPSVAPAADRAADPASDGSADSAHTAPAASVPGAGSFDVGRPESAPVPANAGPNPDFPNNAAPGAPVPGRTDVRGPAESEIVDRPSALVEVPSNAPLLPARQAPTAGLALARANDGLPMVLDPFAVASRAVLVLIGSVEPAKHIARTAIEMSIEHDSSAAIDVVIPRAIDLVLRRAAHLVSIGAGPKVVDHYTERLELWRRLARRSGLEPAAIVLTLAPFPIPTVASMLRVSLAEVEACIDDWYAGIDPDDSRPRSIAPAPEPVIDLRDSARNPATPAHSPAHSAPSATARRSHRRSGWARFRSAKPDLRARRRGRRRPRPRRNPAPAAH